MARKKLSKESRKQHKGEELVEKEEKQMESAKTLKEMETLIKNLKSLNQILAKETMEKRFQIENLRAEVEELSGEAPLRSDIERGICRLVVSSAFAEGNLAAAAEREEAERRARKGESAFESLQDMMEEEREEAERRSAELQRTVEAKCGLEAEVRVLKEAFGLLKKEEEGLRLEVADLERRNGGLEKNVGILEKGKVETVKSLEMQTRESAMKLAEWKEKIEKVEREKEGLGLEIIGLEKRNGELEKEIGRLLADVSGLEKEKEENEMRFEAKIRESALELDDLRGRMEVIVREKDAIEQTNANREAEIAELKGEVTKLNLSLSELQEMEKRNGELEGEISRLLGCVNGLEEEKEEIEMRYEVKIRDSTLELDDLRARMGVIEQEKDAIEEAKANREAEVLELKKEVMKLNLNLSVLQELEKRNGELEGEIGRLLGSVDGLEKEKEENGMRYEAKIRDSTLELDDLRARMGMIEQEKDAIEEAKANKEAEVLELKKEVMKLNLNLPVLQELEKRSGELEGEIGRLLLIVSGLEEEKEEKETRFEMIVRESALELDDLKERMGAIVLQKDAMERAKTGREVEILELKKEATKLNSSLLELQELSREYREKNAQLQTDRDAAQRELDIQREEAGCLKLQLDKLTESRDGTLQEFSSLLYEKEEGKRSIKLLSEQKSSLEKSLLVAQANYRDMEGKVAVAEATSAKALSLLKATVEAVNGSEKTRENGAIDDDDDDDDNERIRPFAGELETIKTAHNSRVVKMEELNRELEAVKSALEEAGKKKAALWRWLYPATTTFIAAVSLAYAAKAR